MIEDNRPLRSLSPGGFSDETQEDISSRNEILQEAARESQRLREERKRYIEDVLENGQISQEYATLLSAMRASTLDPASAELAKTKASVELGKVLHDTPFTTGRVVYIGSGTDWHFPVALGARNIDMEDIGWGEENPLQEEDLLESIRVFDPNVSIDETSKEVKFQLNLNGSPEDVSLRLVGGDVSEYRSDEPLGGVLEILGPTKGFTDSLLLPGVAQNLQEGAQILNFDYSTRNINTIPQGTTDSKIDEFTIYEVVDPKLLSASVQDTSSNHRKGPDLSALRAAIHNENNVNE